MKLNTYDLVYNTNVFKFIINCTLHSMDCSKAIKEIGTQCVDLEKKIARCSDELEGLKSKKVKLDTLADALVIVRGKPVIY